MKVQGDSLAPEYKQGDFVLVLKIPLLFNSRKPGDVLAFKNEHYGTLIKKIERVDLATGGYIVYGTHESSVASRKIGPVSERDVIGKVYWHIRTSS